MVEEIITYLQQLSPFWIYASLFFIAYIENLFPPSPSDLMIVAGGYLVGIGRIDFFTALLISTLGSTTGFMTMYKIGDWFGLKIIETGRIKYFPLESVHKVETWFRKFGYWLIIANRFLSGTRAVVGFFAGMAEVKFIPTAILCFISAFIWNWILVYAGTLVGKNWELIGFYLTTYSQIVTSLLVMAALIGIIIWYQRRGKKND
ncbi:MAG: DedA family protein [Bacteroidota bacterium]